MMKVEINGAMATIYKVSFGDDMKCSGGMDDIYCATFDDYFMYGSLENTSMLGFANAPEDAIKSLLEKVESYLKDGPKLYQLNENGDFEEVNVEIR